MCTDFEHHFAEDTEKMKAYCRMVRTMTQADRAFIQGIYHDIPDTFSLLKNEHPVINNTIKKLTLIKENLFFISFISICYNKLV